MDDTVGFLIFLGTTVWMYFVTRSIIKLRKELKSARIQMIAIRYAPMVRKDK